MNLRYLELIPHNTKIDFIRWRHVAVIASTILNLAILAGVFIWPGLKYGVDFAGGSEIELKFDREIDVHDLRTKIEAMGFGEPTVQVYGDEKDHAFLVRVERVALLSKEVAEAAHQKIAAELPGLKSWAFDEEVGDKIDLKFAEPVEEAKIRAELDAAGIRVKDVRTMKVREGDPPEYLVLAQGPGDRIGESLKADYGDKSVEVRRTEYVGPTVGKQLRVQAFLAVLYSLIAIVIYCGLRFDFRFAPGVITSLLHDAVITMGFFLVSRHEFNLTALAAVLTIVGYSVNDTIVVYDRIRENLAKHRGKPLPELINLSINEMLGRTILTSGVTFLSLVGFLLYGVGSIWDFAAAMSVGIVTGTYSSIYIAAPTTIWLNDLLSREKPGKGAEKPAARKPADAASGG